MSNHIPLFHVDVIIYPCHNPDAGLPDLFIFFFCKAASHPGWGCGEQIQFLLLIIFHNHANTIFFAIYHFHVWQVSLQMTPVKYEWDWKDPTDTVCKIKMRNITHQKLMNDVTSMELMTGYGPVESHLFPDSKVHGAKMGPAWVLSAPDGSHVGPMALAIRVGEHLCCQKLPELFRKMCIASEQEVGWYCMWKSIWNTSSTQILTESIICPLCFLSFLHFEFCTKYYSHISLSCAKSNVRGPS